MSKIFRTPSSRQNELIVPMSNLITESPWLEYDFLKQTNLHIRFVLPVYICIRYPSFTRKTTTISIVQCSKQCVQYFVSLIIQTHKTMTSATESL